MTPAEFDAYVDSAVAALEAKQGELTRKYKLGSLSRFNVDLALCTIEFFDGDTLAVEATVTPVGSYVEAKRSWQWAWANVSLPEDVRAKSVRLKQLAKVTGMKGLASPTVEADQDVAWGFLAMACELLDAAGAYTVPTKTMRVYLALHDVRKARPRRVKPPQRGH
jgi:hypothetical protein